jgi:hypothetical protein
MTHLEKIQLINIYKNIIKDVIPVFDNINGREKATQELDFWMSLLKDLTIKPEKIKKKVKK